MVTLELSNQPLQPHGKIGHCEQSIIYNNFIVYKPIILIFHNYNLFLISVLLETKVMAAQLEIIKNNSGSLTSLTVDLQAGLNATKDNLTDIQNQCNSINTTPPPTFCNDTNTDSLATQADFSNLPDVSKELQNVEDVVNQDFEQSASDVSDHSHYIFAITGQSLMECE